MCIRDRTLRPPRPSRRPNKDTYANPECNALWLAYLVAALRGQRLGAGQSRCRHAGDHRAAREHAETFCGAIALLCERCDRPHARWLYRAARAECGAAAAAPAGERAGRGRKPGPVSYTHLTLPT